MAEAAGAPDPRLGGFQDAALAPGADLGRGRLLGFEPGSADPGRHRCRRGLALIGDLRPLLAAAYDRAGSGPSHPDGQRRELEPHHRSVRLQPDPFSQPKPEADSISVANSNSVPISTARA